MGLAKSYAERLFDFPEIGPQPPADATPSTIVAPIEHEQAAIAPEALELIVNETRGYPTFVQEWCGNACDTAADSPINVEDVHGASRSASQNPGPDTTFPDDDTIPAITNPPPSITHANPAPLPPRLPCPHRCRRGTRCQRRGA